MKLKIPFTNLIIAPEIKTSSSGMRMPMQLQGSSFSIAGVRPDFGTFFVVFDRCGAVSACIRELRRYVGRAGYRIHDADDEDKPAPEMISKGISAILNFFAPANQLFGMTVHDVSLTGNAYWFLVRNIFGTKVVGIKRVDPRTMSVVTDPFGVVVRYIQRVSMGTVEFMPEEIIHFKDSEDTRNPVFGAPPLMGVSDDIRADIEAARTNAAFLENDAIPAAHYLMKSDLRDKELETAIAELKEQFKGGKNRGKSAILPDVEKIVMYDRDYSKLQFMDMRQFDRRSVCSALDVPEFLLGFTESVNNNNGIELMRGFYEGTVQPLEKNLLADTITRELFPRLGMTGEYRFAFGKQFFTTATPLEEFKAGTITLRQYRQATGKPITDEDELTPNFDAYIIHQAAGARLIEDVGVDPVDLSKPEAKENLLAALEQS